MTAGHEAPDGRRDRRVLHPGAARLPVAAAPDLRGRSYRIDAELDGPLGDAEGVLLACGDAQSGFAVFVRDATLSHVYRHAGTSTTTIGAVTGRSTRLGVAFAYRGDHATIELTADDVVVGRGTITQAARARLAYSGFDVGRDCGVPVGDYKSPFAFNGPLGRVVITVDRVGDVDDAGSLAFEFATG